jgi:hypothetical protein
MLLCGIAAPAQGLGYASTSTGCVDAENHSQQLN